MNTYSKAVLLCAVFGLTGCLESSFDLADQSRLPKWFDVPEKAHREDYSLRMDLYTGPSGGKAVFTLNKSGSLFGAKTYTINYADQPSSITVELENPPKGYPSGYPAYKVVKINGVVDIVELRRMEPFFYMTDDPKVWKELGVEAEVTQ